jgi:hypothetical protein
MHRLSKHLGRRGCFCCSPVKNHTISRALIRPLPVAGDVMSKGEVFGTGRNGETVTRVFLRGGGLTANVLTWGAIIQDLRLEGHDAPLVLGFDGMPDYLDHSPFFGATPGRNANRIGGGHFAIDGQEYQLELNEKGVTRTGISSRSPTTG